MEKLKKTLKSKNIITGYLYFYVHFITEVVCFYTLTRILGDRLILWLVPLIYDVVAFMLQGIVGYINDIHRKMNSGLIGTCLLIIGVLIFNLTNIHPFLAILVIAVGNAFMHMAGAEGTLRTCEGKMSHSAIFVAGGSFGVITGKLIGKTSLHFSVIIVLALTMIPFILLADEYIKDVKKDKNSQCDNFNYYNKNINPMLIILLSTFVVVVRSYMGYGIPTQWNQTIIQSIMLYVFMGIGKAVGGILIDTIGMRKVALLSTLGALPFLILGNENMFISLIGITCFSMTMPITLGIIVSVLKSKPGLAFGFTTIGLVLGGLPIFIIKIKSLTFNVAMISILTCLCTVILMKIIRKDEVANNE